MGRKDRVKGGITPHKTLSIFPHYTIKPTTFQSKVRQVKKKHLSTTISVRINQQLAD